MSKRIENTIDDPGYRIAQNARNTERIPTGASAAVGPRERHARRYYKPRSSSVASRDSVDSTCSAYASTSTKEGDHILAVFNWAYGGKEVYLVKDMHNKQDRLPMVASGANFTLIQELPIGTYYYGYMVDGKFVHSPDQPTKTVDNELVNVLDIKKSPPLKLKTRQQSKEILRGVFGHNLPGPNYLSAEPPALPDIFYYRSPYCQDAFRIASEAHVLANHVYRDSKSEEFLGRGYQSYITLYRWTHEESKSECTTKTVAILYIAPIVERMDIEYSATGQGNTSSRSTTSISSSRTPASEHAEPMAIEDWLKPYD